MNSCYCGGSRNLRKSHEFTGDPYYSTKVRNSLDAM